MIELASYSPYIISRQNLYNIHSEVCQVYRYKKNNTVNKIKQIKRVKIAASKGSQSQSHNKLQFILELLLHSSQESQQQNS